LPVVCSIALGQSFLLLAQFTCEQRISRCLKFRLILHQVNKSQNFYLIWSILVNVASQWRQKCLI